MKTYGVSATVLIAAVVAVTTFGAGLWASQNLKPAAPAVKTQAFTPPSDAAIPNDQFGKQVAFGEAIFTDTGHVAPQFVGNDLKCSNCHLDRGRLANSAPMWGAYVLFPQYRAKNGHVNSFQERLQGCFKYSMNGKAPPLGDPILVALESYAAFLAKGARLGLPLPGHGYLKLGPPPLSPDYSRGQDVYSAKCALCHGNDGAGQASDGVVVFPPLWRARSYNWGAGMAEIKNAAGFIKANMPLSQGGKLTDQQAWDVAAFVDSQPRPQDPRYKGSVEETRQSFHKEGDDAYGKTVNGILLGGDGPPSVGGQAIGR